MIAPQLDLLPNAINVPAVGLRLLRGVEQSRRDFLLRRSDGEEITAAPPASVGPPDPDDEPVLPEVEWLAIL